MDKKIISLCDKIINYLIPLMVLGIALAFYLKTYDSCQIKITILHIGGTIVICAWLIKLLEGRRIPFAAPSFPMLLPPLLFLLSGILSHIVFSPFKSTSFEELVRRIIYMMFFMIVFTEFAEFRKMKRMISWTLATGLLASLYGLVQHFGMDPFIWKGAFGERIFSTFGNPNFYAAYLVLITPLVLCSLEITDIKETEKTMVCLAGTSVLGIFYCLMQFMKQGTFQKLSFIGSFLHLVFVEYRMYAFIVVVLVSVMLCFYFRAKNKLHIIFFLLILVNVLLTRSKASYIGFAGGVCAFTALAAFFISAATGKQKKTFLIVFTTLIVLLTSLSVGYLVRQRIDSVRFRVFTWMSTVSLIHDRPIFGNGIGVFKITYPRVRREEIFHIEGKHNTETDHPENEYLEVLHDEGIVGAGIFLWCLATVFSAGIRWLARDMGKEKLNEEGSVKKKTVRIIPRHTYIAGLMASLFGLLVHNLMCVNMRFVSSGFPFWVLMGLTCAQISPAVIKDGRGKVKSSVKYAANLLQIGIIVLSVYLGIFFYRFMEADMYHNIAIAYSKAGQWDEALRYYHRVLKNNPYYTMTHYFMGNVYNDRWDMQKRYKPEWDDKDFKPRDDSERALAKYDDLKKLAPNYVQVHFQVGTVYERLGQWDNALENFKKALALDPVFAPTYFKMGWCYVQKEDWANAEAVYRKAVEWNPGFVQAYVNLGNVYYMQKKLDLALKSYQEALKIEPGNKHLQEVVAQILKFKDRLQ